MFRRILHTLAAVFFGIRHGLHEIGIFMADMVRVLDPRQLPGMLVGGSKEAIEGGKVVAATTTVTLAEVLWRIVRSPIDLARLLFTAPGRIWHSLRTQRPIYLLIGLIVFLVFVGGAVWPVMNIFRERRVDAMRREQYRQLDEHFIRGDYEGVKHNLETLVKSAPEDSKVATRLAALEAGVAVPSDAKMARLLMRRHLFQGKLPDSAREARKVVALEDNDWEALIMVAQERILAGDRAEAVAAVEKLPLPENSIEAIPYYAASIGERIFRELGREDRLDDLIKFVAEKYVPAVRHSIINAYEPSTRLQLALMYRMALSQLARRPQLAEYFANYQDLCHGIANAPNVNAPILASVGEIQEAMRYPALQQMRQMNLITAEQHDEFSKEIEGRLAIVWSRVREMDAKNYLGYVGPAMQHVRAGRFSDGLREIESGIGACGPLPPLLEKKADIMRMMDPVGGLAFLEKSIAPDEKNPAMYKVLAEAALAAQRPDKAMEAIRKARALAPELPWAIRLEAEVLLQMGRPTEAAAGLKSVLASIGLDGPASVLYVRALVGAGSPQLAEQFLVNAVNGKESLGPILLGIEELLRLGRAVGAETCSRRVLLEDPGNYVAQILLGDACRIQAEQATGGWDKGLAEDAMKAYRGALRRDPDLPVVLAQVAWLQLAAFDLAQEADITMNPLRERVDVLPPVAVQMLGIADVVSGRYEAGRIKLQRVLDRQGPEALTLAYLALAYHGMNQSGAADDCLNRALAAPKSSPRRAELVEKIRLKIARGIK
ncbi:MAG: hypothetical protein K1X57_01435 [Gemmataceae bacterium]|nr:hypothetical protein [Gemmataceae bacterium]